MLGLNPVHWICILVTSTTTSHDGSVVSALTSQAKVSLSPDPPHYARVWHCQTRSDANTLTTWPNGTNQYSCNASYTISGTMEYHFNYKH